MGDGREEMRADFLEKVCPYPRKSQARKKNNEPAPQFRASRVARAARGPAMAKAPPTAVPTPPPRVLATIYFVCISETLAADLKSCHDTVKFH